MRIAFFFSGIGLLSLLLLLTSFTMTHKDFSHHNHKGAPAQLYIENNSITPGRTITVAMVGPYNFSLSIPPGGYAVYGIIGGLSGPITVSVSCSTAWKGTLEYAEDDETVGCTTTGTGQTHSLTCTASSVVVYVVQINDATYPCD